MRIEYPITQSYMSHWDNKKALRELIQNAIDSGEYMVDDGNADLVIIRNRLIKPITVDELTLFGDSNKSSEHIGRFGEGFKLAMLVFARDNYASHVVKVGDCEITSAIENNRFVINITNPDQLEVATDFVAEISYSGVANDVKSLLMSRHDLKLVFNNGQGSQVLHGTGKSKLFVSGMYICDINTKYSYNFHPRTLQLGRDREAVSEFDLHWQTAILWGNHGSPEDVAEMLHSDVSDVRSVKYMITDRLKEAIAQHFFDNYGSDAVIATSSVEAEMLRTLNPKQKVVYLGGSGSYSGISRSSYAGEKSQLILKSVPTEKPSVVLQSFMERNKKHMRAKAAKELKMIALASSGWIKT